MKTSIILWRFFCIISFTLIPQVAHSYVDVAEIIEKCQNLSIKNPSVAINNCTTYIDIIKHASTWSDLAEKGLTKKDLEMGLSRTYWLRAYAFLYDHQYDKAISDVTESAKVYDDYNRYLFLLTRGLAFYAKNEFKLAATDFESLYKEFPDSKKTIVFLYIFRNRYGVDGLNELEQGFKKVGNETGELVPVQLFLEKFSKKFIYRQGERSSLEIKILLWFYLAQYELITGNIDTAKKLFSIIVNEGRGFDCVDTKSGRTCYLEYWGATIELRRLNSKNQ